MHRFLLFVLLLPCILSAGTFEDLMKEAAGAETLPVRYEKYFKAIEAGTPEQKGVAAEQGFNTASRAGNAEEQQKFAEILAKAPGISDELRTEAAYYTVILLPAYDSRSRMMGYRVATIEEVKWALSMPGLKPAQEYQLYLRLGRDRLLEGPYPLGAEALLKAYNHPAALAQAKPGIMIDYIECLRQMQKRQEALAEADKLAKQKLTTYARIRLRMMKIRVLTESPEYYFEPSKEDLDQVYAIYEEIRNMKIRQDNRNEISAYNDAMISYVHFCFFRKEYTKCEQVAEKLLTDKKHPLGRREWAEISTMRGRALIALHRYQEAITIFEKLSDMKHAVADSLRYLGEAYYGNKDYTLAIGCFKTALDILREGHCDDDRPTWCERWVDRVSWFTNGAAELDRVVKKHEKRIGAVSAGKSNLDGVKSPMRKTQKKAVRDIKDISSGVGEITDDGLQLD